MLLSKQIFSEVKDYRSRRFVCQSTQKIKVNLQISSSVRSSSLKVMSLLEFNNTNISSEIPQRWVCWRWDNDHQIWIVPEEDGFDPHKIVIEGIASWIHSKFELARSL
ncbi:hypothetical protein RDI58_026798 [Solanum bulbocastanum]|uniref:Uncharacterized protein n=1 Tax=Solanum bulbocastanum TaxID=147425 RepID=A0AAN8Y1S8_SOLBU